MKTLLASLLSAAVHHHFSTVTASDNPGIFLRAKSLAVAAVGAFARASGFSLP